MNCGSFRRDLLACERLEELSAPLAQHLASCFDCQSWHARALRIEKTLPALPVPPSNGPEALLRHLSGTSALPSRRLQVARTREWGRRKVALAFALAASLLVLALGWWVWPHSPAPRPAPYAKREKVIERRDALFAHAQTPDARVRTLAGLSEEILDQARSTEDQSQLDRLAENYAWLVQNDLIEWAACVPAADRAAVLLPLAAQFSQRESEITRLAVELGGQRAESLRTIAMAARVCDSRLRQLVGV
jgi:hypothetical protein